MREILISTLRFYKLKVSPILVMFFGSGCRFTPTCSVYAECAIKKYGIIKGVGFSIKRILKCHPFSVGGYDPIS